MSRSFAELTARLAELSQGYDLTGCWPAESIGILTDFQCRRWMIPTRYGGLELPAAELIAGYEALAKGCMSTALIFTQHDAAVDIILTGDNSALRDRFGPELAAGKLLMTVGISQLTTSHQQGPPAMRVDYDGRIARFTGLMPWATGAQHVDWIVTGGVLSGGKQMLAAIPSNAEGLSVDPPMPLSALQATHTAAVRCDHVAVDADHIIRGPVEKALAIRGTVRPMVVSATGVGLAGAMVALIESLLPRCDRDMQPFAATLIERYAAVRRDLHAAADRLDDPTAEAPSSAIRVAVNDLLVRLAILLTTLAKGSGWLKSHPAQRLAREALFFLVWSAPATIQRDTLKRVLTGDTN